MKKNLHPDWHDNAAVTCSCGNSFEAGSTQTEITIDICNKCHPFFTGEMKFVDRQGRVDKFNKMRQAAQAKQKAAADKAQAQEQQEKPEENKSYQEILREKKAELRNTKKSN
ncbi:MAG: 50S ribosomal protein L31 [Candidatus Pacebacteria bacterium]|nr:50S ribosomal protein L31 [Candidatus Paceibacterota bacterium]